MTKVFEQFTLASAVLADGAAIAAPSGVLPERVEPTTEPSTFVGITDIRSCSTHYEFNQVAGKIYDRKSIGDGCAYIDEIQRGGGAGKELAQYTENSAILFETTSGTDLVMDASAGNYYAVTDTWTLEVMAYIDTANVTTLTKYDGSLETTGGGWLLRCANPSNQEFEFELRDGTNILTIRCNTGVDLRGSITGAHQFVVTLDGSGGTIAPAAIELYLDGVKQTKNVINAGPVGDYGNIGQDIEAGFFPSGGPLLGASDRGANTFDQIVMYPSVLTDAQVLEHYEIATLTKDLPTATWTYTASASETVHAAGVPGMLANLLAGQDRLFTNAVKTRTFYSKNAGVRTEFRESISGLSVALSAAETFEVIVEWQGADSFDTGISGWVADACGQGPWIVVDDGTADVPPIPPTPISDTSSDGLSVTLDIEVS